MAQEKSKQQKITRAIGLGLITGVIVWLIALCFAADYINKSVANTVYELRIGPFWLSTLSRKATEGGFIASIRLQAGLPWFVVFFGLTNGIIAFVKHGRTTPTPKKEEA